MLMISSVTIYIVDVDRPDYCCIICIYTSSYTTQLMVKHMR